MTYEKTQDGKLKEIGEQVTYSPSSEFTRENISAQIARWDAAIADGGYDNYISGKLGVAQTSPTAVVDVGASTTARSSLRIRSGTAPTSPNDGDIWFDGTDLKIRISGATKTVTVT